VSVPAGLPIDAVEGRWRISALVRRLQAIYGIAVVAQHALRYQAAEQDVEIADCLRVGVCDPIADQIRALQEITERRGGSDPATKSSRARDPRAPARMDTKAS
jgi:hypothetical protein